MGGDPQLNSVNCHVWTAPALQGDLEVSCVPVGAVMYPAYRRGTVDRWP
jgi:hypothetical protein